MTDDLEASATSGKSADDRIVIDDAREVDHPIIDGAAIASPMRRSPRPAISRRSRRSNLDRARSASQHEARLIHAARAEMSQARGTNRRPFRVKEALSH